ncbi:MAG: glycoside hydrolase family 43 protein [Polyangiaceae bacterium]
MYRNPILTGFHPDPSICRVGHDYYLVTSTFEYFPGVPIFHSRDLVHFRAIGHCLTRDSQLPLTTVKSSEGIFAPTLRYHDGVFYMVTTNVEGGGNFYVTATDPAGPWSEPVWLNDGGVDPSLFFDDDGKVYYTRQGGGERGGAHQAELDLVHGRLKSEPRMIWPGTGGTWPEGPHLYKRNGLYYLCIAEGGTGYSHMETVARSNSPWGPFEECPHNPVLTHRDRPAHPLQALGHADFIDTPEGKTWLVCLGIRPSPEQHHHLGRETLLAPVEWDAAGWPVVNGNGTLELELDDSGLPARTSPILAVVRDDFDSAELGLDYNFVRNPLRENYSLSARPGHLRLIGSATSLDEVGQVTFVGRRQEHLRCRMATELDFEPKRAGDAAGLTLRANEANHYDLLVVGTEAERRVQLRARRLGVTVLVSEATLETGPVQLEVRAERDRYEFSASQSGRRNALGALATQALSSESAGGFTGVYVGLVAFGPTRLPSPADFDWFDYAPEPA